VVGVNKYSIPEEIPIATLKIDPEIEERQIQRVRKVKRERNSVAVKKRSRGFGGVSPSEKFDGTICEAVRRTRPSASFRYISRRVACTQIQAGFN